jgi:VWFA-related protein
MTPHAHAGGFSATLLLGTLMMAAMMAPAAAARLLALVSALRRQVPPRAPLAPAGLFLLGYLSLWSAFGLAAALVHTLLPGPAWALGALLLVAGLYQLTPAKAACLRHCRRPFREPPLTRGAALRAGLEDGVFCMGSCWALMALCMGSGAAGLLAMAAVTALVLLEKLAPRGPALARAAGALLVAAGALVLGGLPVHAQAPPAGGQQPPVFATGVEIVALDIAVVDKDGRPVRDLTPADFELTVDGKPRRVVSAEFISQGASDDRPVPSPPPAHFSSNERLVPGRLVLIIVDQGNIAMGQGRDVIQAAGRLLDRLGETDKVGLLSLPGPEPREEFTSNRDRIREALGRTAGRARFAGRRVSITESIAYMERDDLEERWAAVVRRECPGEVEIGCLKDIEREASQVYWEYREQSQRSIGTLHSAFDVLKGIEGQKVVVLITQGLGMPDAGSRPGRVSSEMHELARAASDARVAFFSVQVKADYGASVDSDLSFSQLDDDRTLHSQGLTHLAVLARGAVFRGNPDLAFDRLSREISGYYMLGFEPESRDRDGKRHNILVSVKRPGLTVRNRRSVPLPPPEDAKTAERALVASLRAPVAATSIPVRVATYAVRDPAPGKVRLLISAEIGGASAPGALDVGWVLMDGRGKTAASSVQRERSDAPAPNGAVPFSAVATVEPGLYTLKLAARDRGGRQGSVEHPVKAALVEAGGLELSDLMLGLPPTAGSGLRPGIGLDGGGDPLLAHLELYGDPRRVTVSFEVAHDEHAAALFTQAARLASVRGRNVAQAIIPISGLSPGDYVVRASVTMDGKTIGTPVHPFRIKG